MPKFNVADRGGGKTVQDLPGALHTKGGGRPVEYDKLRLCKDDMHTGQQLLLTERQHALPVLLRVESVRARENTV